MGVYEAFNTATQAFTAVALVRDGQAVGRVVIKHGGASVTAYVQVWGIDMARGRATGGGYDKASAAVSAAVDSMTAASSNPEASRCADVIKSCDFDSGYGWERVLSDAGFTIARVI